MNQSLHAPPAPTALPAPVPVSFPAADGLSLGGHFWPAASGAVEGASPASAADKIVILNPATGVLARYYHRYARFLAGHGFDVLTYDYRGIGASRPPRLRGCGYRWRDWGELDFEAALSFTRRQRPESALLVVGHSIGGFLPGLAPSAPRIARMLTVGAQYAWWGDYARHRRWRLFAKWHLAMPALTTLCGYFPGRRLGWLEDLPAGVAYEWSFRRSRFERSHPPEERKTTLTRMAAATAPILAVRVTDDELGTGPALRRTLDYYTGAPRTLVRLAPALYGRDSIGHFSLFHDSHTAGFWTETLRWLRDGQNPWPAQTTAFLDPQA